MHTKPNDSRGTRDAIAPATIAAELTKLRDSKKEKQRLIRYIGTLTTAEFARVIEARQELTRLYRDCFESVSQEMLFYLAVWLFQTTRARQFTARQIAEIKDERACSLSLRQRILDCLDEIQSKRKKNFSFEKIAINLKHTHPEYFSEPIDRSYLCRIVHQAESDKIMTAGNPSRNFSSR